MALLKLTHTLVRPLAPLPRILTRTLRGSYLDESKQHDDIAFSQNYEDSAVVEAALELKAGANVLTIASCGANAMTLLLDDPAKVTAVDISPTQIALAKLQATAIKRLAHQDFLDFVGVDRYNVPGEERLRIYEAIKIDLEANAREYWNKNADDIRDGLLYCGIFDYQMAKHGDTQVSLVHDKDTIEKFLSLGDNMEEQIQFYEKEWKTWRWLRAFKNYSDDVFAKFETGTFPFNNPQWFEALTKELETVIRNQPNNKNPYMELFLLGNLTGKRGMRKYLMKENYDIIKSRLDRMEWVTSEMTQYLSNYLADNGPKFDAVYHSNIPDWMDIDEHNDLIEATIKVTNFGGRICYWNLIGNQKPWPIKLIGSKLQIEDKVSKKAMLLNRFPWWEPIWVASVV